MAEKTNMPEIRFAGFTDPWEQRKLGELGVISTGNTPSTSCPDYYSDAGIPWVTPTDICESTQLVTDKSLSELGQTVARTVPSNSILCTCIASIGKNAITSTTSGFNQQINALVPDTNLYEPYFLYVQSSLWSETMKRNAAAGTMQIVNKSEFSDLITSIPSKDEQYDIASLFFRFNSLITLHQRKYDKLCAVKKSMLDKMFPKPGETEPEIRFAGFTDPWELRKFSDLTDRISIQSSDSDLPQVEYEDIIPGEGTLNKELRDKEGGKTGIKFYVGDVLYGKLRPYLMNYLYPQFNGVAVGDFWVLRAAECDSSFLYRLVQTGSFQRLANVSSGSKMPRADWNLISQSFFAVPANHAEQKAIAKSLADLDNLITLHQRKLNLLKNTKKSLLDRMFV